MNISTKRIIAMFFAFAIITFASPLANATAPSTSGAFWVDFATWTIDHGKNAGEFIDSAKNQIWALFNDNVCPGYDNASGVHVFEKAYLDSDAGISLHYVCKYCHKDGGEVLSAAYDSTYDGVSVEHSGVFTKTLYLPVSYMTEPAPSMEYYYSYDGADYVALFKSGEPMSYSIVKSPSQHFNADGSSYIDYTIHAYAANSSSSSLVIRAVSDSFSVPVTTQLTYVPAQTQGVPNYTIDSSGNRTRSNNASVFLLVHRVDSSGNDVIVQQYYYASYPYRPDSRNFIAYADYVYYFEYFYYDTFSTNVGETTTTKTHTVPYITNYPAGYGTTYHSANGSIPSNVGAETRPAGIIQNYNNNSTTNKFYIGTVDNSNTVINIYDGNIFDEQSRIFTEPVTGTQYQCTGWTYNYSSGSRGYILSLFGNTYKYNGTTITKIGLLYLDDALYILGFSGQPDVTSVESMKDACEFCEKYSYVVSEDSSVHTHTYVSEVIQEPTCTETGVRVYQCTEGDSTFSQTIPLLGHQWQLAQTVPNEYDADGNLTTQGYKLYICSRCGEVYRAEDDTPPPEAQKDENFFTWFREAWQHFRDWYSSLDFSNIGSGGGSGGKHTHTYSEEVIKEATCTVSGSVRYTCVECGDSYTEVIEPLEHDYAASETVPDKYTFPDGITCPNGSGHSLTHELDGEVYHVTCSDCGEEFDVDAVFEYGYTVYTCTRCGEQYTESNREKAGLFDAIGDFVADGINWVADKLEQLVDAFSGISDIFDRFSGTLEESTGDYPALFAEIVAVMPEDLMAVIWFAVIGAFAVAAWRKWFG